MKAFHLLAPVLALTSLSVFAQSAGVQLADGFDYPFGNLGYSAPASGALKVPIPEGFAASLERNGVYPSIQQSSSYHRWGDATEWYNAQDTGSYLSERSGFHPGEDWNRKPKPRGDVGQIVYCVANGEVKGIKEVKYDGIYDGWLILIRHWLPDATPYTTSDNPVVDSIYLHVAPLSINGVANVSGTIGKQSDLGLTLNTPVTKNQPLARIAGLAVTSPHLHFEMRDKLTSTTNLWPNDNGLGYYSSYAKMRLDGVIDPSDFIDQNRTLYGLADVPNLKLNHPSRVEMSNCVTLGIMNNDGEKAWLSIERTLSRGEVIGLLKNAATAYKTSFFDNLSNVNSIPQFTGDAELAASSLYNSVQLFAQKGFVDVSQPSFRVNDFASFGEAVHFIWRVFNLGSGGPAGAEELFKYRRDKLKDALFIKPASLNWNVLDAVTPLYSRNGDTLTRLITPKRDWLYQRGIVDMNFNYADPIRRHVMAKLIINTLLWRMSNPTQTSL